MRRTIQAPGLAATGALLAVLLSSAWLQVAAPPVAAVESRFGAPTATATWDVGIEFIQPVSFSPSSGLARAEILLTTPGSDAAQVRVVPAGAGTTRLEYTLRAREVGLLPNTTITARWRLVGVDGSVTLGPAATARYDDTRFAWETAEGALVRVHWYQGGAAFGRRALEIGSDAVARAAGLLGVTETERIDFFVYADQGAFYDALGPGTRENVGGQANAEIRTLFALITPSEIDAAWVESVIPHELTHLVFDTAVQNPYHFPPRWLNEGLAVYLAQGYGASDRSSVERAAADGSLMPLEALGGQFPTTRNRFALAYAESVSAVDDLIRQHGEDALVRLIRSYADGVTDDEAFTAAIGMDLNAFDAAWRGRLGADAPVAHGPQPAPTGPVPDDWTSSAGPGAPPGSSVPSGDGSPGVAPSGPSAPPDGGGSSGVDVTSLLAAIAGVLAVVGLVTLLLARFARRSRSPGGGVPR